MLIVYTSSAFFASHFVFQFEERCEVKNSTSLLCYSPAINPAVDQSNMKVEFLLDNVRINFNSVSQSPFTYEPNPTLPSKNISNDPNHLYRYKPGSVISVEVGDLYLYGLFL